MSLPTKIAFVDIETTGSNLNYDRIIEIAVLRFENGKITKKYQSLINPNHHLPPEITLLTGIASSDLENAPTFREAKNDILKAIKDCTLVAHNVRFDYGFMKSEFKRLELDFSAKHFCTVRLSKLLFPQFRHHNLDAIIERFNLKCRKRHRAFDDAYVLYKFLKIIQKSFKIEDLERAFSKALKKPSQPINLPLEVLDTLPDSPGVYIFYAQNGLPLYIGKSINIRERVLSHFANDYSSLTEMKIAQQVTSIETIKTAGEFSALIKETQLIKKLQPLYNRKLRSLHKLTVVRKHLSRDDYSSLSIETLESIETTDLPFIVGIFHSLKQAENFLTEIAKGSKLCKKMLGLEKTSQACFGYRINQCKGACLKKEDVTMFNLRFNLSFSAHQIKPWPFAGPILVEERHPEEGFTESFIIDKWCLLAKSRNCEFESLGNHIFDLDTYKILVSFLRSKKPKKIKTLDQSLYHQLLS